MQQTFHTVTDLPLADYIASYRDCERFMGYCRQCHNYGRRWSCPPFDFETDALLHRYTHLWIIGTRIEPDLIQGRPCTSVQERIERCRTIIAAVRKTLDKELLALETQYPGSRVFLPGSCFGCPEGACTRILGKACIHPEKLRNSLESFGFDLDRTATQLLGIELQWSHDERMPRYLTLISGLMTPTHNGPDHFPNDPTTR